MLKIEINLCKDKIGFCSPVLMITEDSSDESCPIILPDKMGECDAVEVTKMLKRIIEDKYHTVKEAKKAIYG